MPEPAAAPPPAAIGEPCPGCGGRSSEDTLACPWCGRPLHGGGRSRPGVRALTIVFLVAVAVGGLGWFATHFLALR